MFAPDVINALRANVGDKFASFLQKHLASQFVRHRVEEQLWTRTIAELVTHIASEPVAIPILASAEDTERGDGGVTMKASLQRELRRRVRQYPDAYDVPLIVLLVLQLCGYTIATIINICAWAWEGCMAFERRSPGARVLFPQAILGAIVPLVALHRDGVYLDNEELRRALRWMWHRPFTDHQEATLSFTFATILARDRISEYVAAKLIAHAPPTLIAAIASATGDQRLTRDECAALASAMNVVRVVDTQQSVPQLIEGIREHRGRIDTGVLLRTVRAVGAQRALALHQFTPQKEVVIAASAMIDARETTLMRYVATWRACQERALMPFEAYIACTMAWDAEMLSRVWRALPDAGLLQQIIKSDRADVLVRALDSGFPAHDIASGGVALLRLLTRVPPARWDVIRDALSLVPTTSFAEQFVRLPAAVCVEPHIRAMLRENPLRIAQPSVLRLAHAAARRDIPLVWDLLCACDEADPWQSRQCARDAYGLALRFCDAGQSSTEALVHARDACSDLSPRTRVRALRDAGYFRWHVLDRFTSPIAEVTTARTTQSPSIDAVPAQRAVRKPQRPDADARGDAERRDRRNGGVRDLRTLHLQLDLRDLAPHDTIATDAAAIIAHGFCELGKGRPRAGEQYFPVELAHQNIRNRCNISADARRNAWRWLESIGIIRTKKNGEVCTLELANRARNPTADTVARRVRKFLHDLRVSLRT